MSQRYKSFTKGMEDRYAELPPDVKRVGYLKKLKKMKKRFFVLHSESDNVPAKLEYYSSEKKWRSGGEPRRSIELKSCFNIGRKLHSKQKFVIALYTEDDCFSIVTETAEDLELWLADILEVQQSSVSVDEDSKGKPIYEHVWQVVVDDNDLEFSRNITGPYRIALSSKTLTLIKMSPSTEKVDILEFPLMSIRRCGHSGKHFFIELGRSAVTGAGGMWMETEATIVAQNMHETVLGAMKSSRSKEEAGPVARPRSASTSENSKPVPARRPIGIVTPQSTLSASTTLSNSRERCDSLPARPRTISGNLNNSFTSSTLSSPYTSNEPSCQRLSSRPHSMYEWPSFNSPSAKNVSFSPGSLCSTMPCSSNTTSYEDLASLQSTCHSSYSRSLSNEKMLCSKKPISEVPDEYLMMSPSEDNKPIINDYISMNPNSETTDITAPNFNERNSEAQDRNLKAVVDYVDMCTSSPSNSASQEIKPDGYISMAPGGVSEDFPVLIQEGYIDMSPLSGSLPKSNFDESDYLFAESLNNNCFPEHTNGEIDGLILDKVPALLKVTDKDSTVKNNKNCSSARDAKDHHKQLRNSESGRFFSSEPLNHEQIKIGSKIASTRNVNVQKANSIKDSVSFKNDSSVSVPNKHFSIQNNNAQLSEKLKNSPSLNHSCEKQGPVGITCPPLPLRKVEYSTKTESNTFVKNVLPEKQKSTNKIVVCKSNDKFSDQQKQSSFTQPHIFTKDCVQVEENLELGDEQESSKIVSSGKVMNLKNCKVSPVDQNTNFSCLLQKENSHKSTLPCAPLCSVNKAATNVKQSSLPRTAQNYNDSCSSQMSDKSVTRCLLSENSSNVNEFQEAKHVEASSVRDSFLSNFAINSIPETNNRKEQYLDPKLSNDSMSSQSEYVNLNFGKFSAKQSNNFSQSNKPLPPPSPALLDDINYTNIHLGKPYCPTPNPTVATLENIASHECGASSYNINPQVLMPPESSILAPPCSPTYALNKSATGSKTVVVTPKVSCPHTLPAFRKQMSAPAAPASLKVDLPSPGRKSSCPVTASVSMIKPPLPISAHSSRPVPLQPVSGHLRVAMSRSPDHSSVSSISSASDEVSSSHSSPKIMSACGTLNRQAITDCLYENVEIPQKSSGSRPPSVSSEKELNYASLDLAPASKDEIPRSPIIHKTATIVNTSDSLTYAEIDFTKSEGLKNTSGTLREGRL